MFLREKRFSKIDAPGLCCIQPKVGKEKGQETMKSFLWMMGGFCAAAAGFLVWGPKRVQPVQELAKRLEVAWGDHHTVV
ncbi:hypothetical protein P8936_14125 [Edaphobacter paludis]|uniref:YtxH domain-containing protein n=1 Tax=Edaphobacter paludis TaxID=3035702 RepID=A0AAU7D5I1_9BACT